MTYTQDPKKRVVAEEVDGESMWQFVLEVVKIFVLALVIIMPIRIFLFQPFFVQGASMEPNFEDGEYLIINELGYKETTVGVGDLRILDVQSFKNLVRGDVIVFRYPHDPKQFFIKRVIGLPGETVIIRNGAVFVKESGDVREHVLDESFYLAKDVSTKSDMTVVLKDDEFFVLGDNRNYSHDSRSWGPLKKEYVIGKVLLRAWPFGEAKIFP